MKIAHGQLARSAPVARVGSLIRHHAGLIVVEVLLFIIALCLGTAVKSHPGPLPYDVQGVRSVQQWVFPHRTLSNFLEFLSTINWPLPSAITMAVLLCGLVILGRKLAALIALVALGLADGSNYLTSQIVRRPRPTDHGIHVLEMVKNFFSYPSGHVEHVWVFYGFLLFLTFQPRRSYLWLWPVRAALVVLLIGMPFSRMLEGEHWTSDVLAGLVYGIFWLLIAVAVYPWARARWPRWRPKDEPADDRPGAPPLRARRSA